MFHITLKESVYKLFILVAVLTFALSVNYLYAAWVGPTQAPPGGNTPTPVNVGKVDQVKDAGLGISALAVFGGSYMQETLGVRTVTISTGGEQDLTIDVEGAVGAQFYCDEDGNNCFTAAFASGGATGDREWQLVNRSLETTYQNSTSHDIFVGITFASPGQGDNFCRFVLEAAAGTGDFVSIDAVDGRLGGRFKNELWGVNAPIPPNSFYRVRAVEAHQDCGNAWIQSWAELR